MFLTIESWFIIRSGKDPTHRGSVPKVRLQVTGTGKPKVAMLLEYNLSDFHLSSYAQNELVVNLEV